MENFYSAFKKPVFFILMVIVFGGIFFYSRIQTSLFPEITFPKVKIIADGDLLPEEQTLVTITMPLENAIKQVPGMQIIKSTTSRGSCEISAFLSWKTDVITAQLQIESRINQIRNDLPPNTQITVERMNPSILPVMGYSLESNHLSLIELKKLAVYTIKPFLSQVEGVAAVQVLGGKDKEFRILLDKQKMSSLSITPEELESVLSQNGFIRSNGFFNDFNRLYLSVTDASFHQLRDIENIVVRNDSKRIVLLKDIARVKIEKAVQYIKINANGKEGVLINIVKHPEANLITTSDEVLQKVKELQKVLPKDVKIKPYYIQAEFVNQSIHSVKDALWIGLALAIVVALMFLRSFKAGITLLIVVPITLTFTIVMLYAFHYTFNIMTLGALVASIGLIIDDAVVIVEQIHRTHEENPGILPRELVSKAIHYLLPAMIGSSLSTIVIFLPFTLMTGVAGAYFQIMTETMIITLTVSFLVTWLGLPVIYILLSGQRAAWRTDRNREGHALKRQTWVEFFTHRPYISVIFVLLLIGTIFYIYPRLETGFLPDMDEGSIVLDYNTPPGSSLAASDRRVLLVEKFVEQTPEVVAYSRRTGAEMGFFITEPNSGDYLIKLTDKRKRTTDEVIEDIRQRVEARVPGVRVDFGQVIGDMLGDLTTSVQPIEIKIFGTDAQVLQNYSRKIASLIEDIPGLEDVFHGIVIAGPSVNVKTNYVKAAQYGLTPADIQNQMELETEGIVTGYVIEGEYLPNFRIAYHDSTDLDVNRIRNTKIFLHDGSLIPLSRVASIEINHGSAEIHRENLQNLGIVSARLNQVDLGTAIRNIRESINKNITLPEGYYIEYAGEYQEQQQSFKELLTILAVAILLVFSVTLILFREFKASLLLIMISVLGVAGGYVALFVTNTPLNVGSYTGLIMIVGIIGENAIFTYQQYKKSFLESHDAFSAITFAISTRLRPKLMTALCAITAMLPLALGIGAGAQLHQPLAISVIGGFIFALPLLLVVLPSFLRIIAGRNE